MARKQKPGGELNATLTDKAYESLKFGILRGEFEEGEYLSEAAVTQRLGLGRTPFREACIRLHRERLLEAVPRRGYRVPEISLRQVRDLFELRVGLESLAAGLALERGRPDQLLELESLLPVSSGFPSTDSIALIDLNTKFHLCLARMSHNQEIVSAIAALLQRMERFSYLELRRSGQASVDPQLFHSAIVASLRKKDATRLRDAVVQDIRKGQMELLGSQFAATPIVPDELAAIVSPAVSLTPEH